ncbi:MAG: LamG-like jellyroll fold domain-containing protein, partial [Verrucomicrobiota bacterium]
GFIDAGPLAGSAPSLTAGFWINADVEQFQIPLYKHPNNAGGLGWTVKMRVGGDLYFRVGSGLNATHYTDTPPIVDAYAVGRPAYMTFTFDNGTARVYVDGVERTVTAGITHGVGDAATPLRIGKPSMIVPGEEIDGVMDEVRISHLVRSADWIRASYLNMISNDIFNCYNLTPPGNADLAVVKTASTNVLLSGTNLTYTIDVRNLSAVGVNNVVVTDTLPAEVSFVSSIPMPNATVGNRLRYQFATLPAGSSTSILLMVSVTSSIPSTITNSALVYGALPDIILSNNLDTAETVLPDSDGDGLANPGDPDDDNDLFPDTAEGIAGTDPLDPTSFFWLRIGRTADDTVRPLTFPSATGRSYRIESATDLFSGTWSVVESNLSATGQLFRAFQTNALPRIYYRVGAERP